jgi:CheY-like chemotaxis protein
MSARCLIVDDNRHFLRVATDLLEQGGINVVGVATTAAQAGQACGELQPDVVLVDIDLGGESGFELACDLTGGAGSDQLSVILISAYSAEDFQDMIADTPGVAFLPKGALSAPAVLAILDDAGGSARHRHHRDSR